MIIFVAMNKLRRIVDSLIGPGFAEEQGVNYPRSARIVGASALAGGAVVTAVGLIESALGHTDPYVLAVGMGSLSSGSIVWTGGAILEGPYMPDPVNEAVEA